MRHTITIILFFAYFIGSIPLSSAQNDSKGSSLGSLDSNALLGDSFNNQDFGKLPTNIRSDTLTLNAKTRIFVYKGNVIVTQGDMTLTSREIEGNYNEQNQIQKIIAKGDVVITKQDIKATSQRATYDAVSSVVVLTDNPQLQQGESVLIADRIKVLLQENRSLAEGNVRVTFVKKDGVTPTPLAEKSQTPALATPAASAPTPQASPSPTGTPKPSAKPKAQPKAKPKTKPGRKS